MELYPSVNNFTLALLLMLVTNITSVSWSVITNEHPHLPCTPLLPTRTDNAEKHKMYYYQCGCTGYIQYRATYKYILLLWRKITITNFTILGIFGVGQVKIFSNPGNIKCEPGQKARLPKMPLW